MTSHRNTILVIGPCESQVVIIPNKDFNFTYLQEIINCYCAKRGRVNEKTEEGKKGIVPNFKKSQRDARKCKMAYKLELDKIKVQKLQCTVTHYTV